MYFTYIYSEDFYFYNAMNRDIIHSDIKWKYVNDVATPYIDLNVSIDEKDYKRNVYIEDIKLYNQNTFINPTNPNDGISIIGIPTGIDNNPKKELWYKKVPNAKNSLFIKDDPAVYEEGHYKIVDGDYVEVVSGDHDIYTYHFISDENNVWFYYDSTTDTYSKVDYDHRDEENFYTKTNIIAYEYKDLQNDSPFKQNFDISNDIIIISVKIHPHPNDKCQSDYILKVLYNKLLFKNDILSAIDEIGSRCVIPLRLIDFFLRMKAFELAAETGDVEFMCRFMKMFNHARGLNGIIEYAPCGCLKH